MLEKKLLQKKEVSSEKFNTTELQLKHEELKNLTLNMLEIIRKQKNDLDSLKLRVEELEKNAPALDYTKKFDNIPSEKKYATAEIPKVIPDTNGYIMFENQAVKSPSGYFIKPYYVDDVKYVMIENEEWDVRRLHARLHLIPSILKSNYPNTEKKSRIQIICNKVGLDSGEWI